MSIAPTPDTVLAELPGWEDAAWSELDGGLNNRTYRLDKDGRSAVLKIDADILKPIKTVESSNIMPVSINIILGNSLGGYPSIAFGLVNGIRKDRLLQISASLSPGNSGSPLINLEGQVVGLLAGR